jgi:selenocysteine lyase/cysteine desulfurase
MERIAAMVKAKGAALLIDATHGAGMMDLDVKRIDPDFLIFPTYKWVLGPYGRAFIYIAKRHQEGVPLEQTGFGRKGVLNDRVPYLSDLSYAPTARRFDMGERDHFVGLEMAAVGLELMASWGHAAIGERCAMLTARLEEGLATTGAIALPLSAAFAATTAAPLPARPAACGSQHPPPARSPSRRSAEC